MFEEANEKFIKEISSKQSERIEEETKEIQKPQTQSKGFKSNTPAFKSDLTIAVNIGTARYDKVGNLDEDGNFEQFLPDIMPVEQESMDWKNFLQENKVVEDDYIIDLSHGPTFKEINSVFKLLRTHIKQAQEFNQKVSILVFVSGYGYIDKSVQIILLNEFDEKEEGYQKF